MRSNKGIKMRRKFKHLTYSDRLKLEALLQAGHKVDEIAEILHFHRSTIYKEIKRGQYEHLNSDYTTEIRYSPEIAQAYMDNVLAAKGPNLKIDKEQEFADRIEEIIINDGYSPAAALAKVKDEGMIFTVCVNTLYSYIEKGVFLNVTIQNLPVRGNKKKRKRKVAVQKRASKGDSIEKRPDDILSREEFGHWEMDTVVGAQGKSKKSLLVLSERKTSLQIKSQG